MKYLRIILIALGLYLAAGLVIGVAMMETHIEPSRPEYRPPEYAKVQPIGTVPAEFSEIVEKNLFENGSTFRDRVLRCWLTENGYLTQMYDLQGNLLIQHNRQVADTHTYHVKSLIPTADGGLLYVLGFNDHEFSDGTWQSDLGVSSTVVKLDREGNVEWERNLDYFTGYMFDDCLETDSGFYFFGELETPETKKQGIYSPTDIHILKMDKTGTVLKAHIIGGSDYDDLQDVRLENGNFVLYCNSQSEDGDFYTPGFWLYTLDEKLERITWGPTQTRAFEKLGEVDGRRVDRVDPLVKNWDAGYVTGVLDYGDFILIISVNTTGYIETELQGNWFSGIVPTTQETVYTACMPDGTILWRTAVEAAETGLLIIR